MHLFVGKDYVLIETRRSTGPGLRGSVRQRMQPGDVWGDVTYEQMRTVPDGWYESFDEILAIARKSEPESTD